MRYEIRLQGTARGIVAAAFEDEMQVTTDDGTTVLRGDLPDQPALHGVIDRIERLGLVLLEVHAAPDLAGSPGAGDDRADLDATGSL